MPTSLTGLRRNGFVTEVGCDGKIMGAIFGGVFVVKGFFGRKKQEEVHKNPKNQSGTVDG